MEIHFIVFYHLSSLINSGVGDFFILFWGILILFWLTAMWRARVYLHVKK